ncbi:MAG: DUF192 domain-containing protein [Terracidiphilus sp.]|jgi:hypothetical protein
MPGNLQAVSGKRMNPLQRTAKVLRQFFAPHGAGTPQGPLQVLNATRGAILATRLEAATSSAARRKGLLGRDRLLPGEGLWIVPCESVHTFFMRFPIDLVYLDRKNRIRKVRNAVGPWRLSACLSAHSILELPAGTIRETRTERGDTIEIVPAPSAENSAWKSTGGRG